MSTPQLQHDRRRASPLVWILSAIAIVLGLILGAIAGIELALRFRLIDIC